MDKDKKGSGAWTKERTPGQPKMSTVQSNKAMIVLPVNSERARRSGKLESFKAGDIEEAVRMIEPKEEFDLQDISLDGPAAEITPSRIRASMQYGRNDPKEVMDDFKIPSLVAGIEAAYKDSVSNVDKYLLLRQRLQYVVVDNLHQLLTDTDYMDSWGLFSNPSARKQLVAAIDREIEKTIELASKYRKTPNERE